MRCTAPWRNQRNRSCCWRRCWSGGWSHRGCGGLSRRGGVGRCIGNSAGFNKNKNIELRASALCRRDPSPTNRLSRLQSHHGQGHLSTIVNPTHNRWREVVLPIADLVRFAGFEQAAQVYIHRTRQVPVVDYDVRPALFILVGPDEDLGARRPCCQIAVIRELSWVEIGSVSRAH